MESKILKTEDLSAYYDFKDTEAVKEISTTFPRKKITAIMGPSGCGKTTFLRCLNRMHELTDGASTEGKIWLKDKNINAIEPIKVRRQIGMVFQHPNPFPTMSIFDNVIAGYKLNGIKKSQEEFRNIVEKSLREAGLWSEVKNDLHKRGANLSGGQKQRLCIARALAINPEIILMDEPTSALDPVATKHIEELIQTLKENVTVILVTHNMSQAGRVSDYAMFMYLGEMIETGNTDRMFTNPREEKTEKFLTGKIG